MVATVDTVELETKVKEMYRHVAQEPGGNYHFELGEPLALRVGYDADRLKNVPTGAVESFAGVGFFFDLAALTRGETVVDLGSGSGMDAFYAADYVGSSGRVVGIDFTLEQLEKARKLAAGAGAAQVEFLEGRIEAVPLPDASVDCVISNGVINLAPDKNVVFAEAARVLRQGGRLAIADIITEKPLTEAIVCNADLWASCIGGAAEQEIYLQAIESAGFTIDTLRVNTYAFLSDQARNASAKYGVKSVSVLATKSAF
ncbi:methyltransferase domain-containing protein [Nocardioides pocheonensis]|uniref:Arsenite methyltransferase n=1 Tax=Nocardioides pocheonensis TaxID=661485 RepID=A0A3N0GJ59_9ACTN|nr:methyltransferase domain-containing protein [Nocardioides pocheonensis]RNM12080.1 methyltransferase domain-containing protein [Nocardioides pocheonensis]